MKFNKALFLDLDGTIITTRSGETFPKTIDDWKFLPNVLNKIKFYSDEGYIVCIVTNQGGIELGYVTQEDFETKFSNIIAEIEQFIRTDVNALYCMYMNGYYRKPNPGMAYQLAQDLSLNLKNSIMVGDSDSDKEFADNAGIGTFMFATDFTERY